MREVEHNNISAVKIITLSSFISIFVFAFIISLSSVLVNEIVEAFSLTGANQGIMSSMHSLGTMVALLITPAIQGRIGKVTMLAFACGLQALMLLAGGMSPALILFCAAYILLGLGSGLVDTYSNSLIVDVHKEDSPKYLGYLHGLFGVGGLVAPIAVYALLPLMGWRGVHYVLAAVTLGTAVTVYFLSRRVELGLTAPLERKLNRADLIEYVSNKRNLILLLAAAFASASQTGMLAWIVRYMTLRFDAAVLGALSISVFWICATVNRFIAMRIKVAPMKLFFIGALLSAFFLVIGIISDNPVVMCVMAGAVGFSGGHFMPVLFSVCAIGYEGKTTFPTSVMMFVMGIARILIPLATAYVGTVMSASAGMVLPVVAVLLAALFSFLHMNTNIGRKTA